VKSAVTSMGTRTTKRNTWKGRYRPEASVEIGKNGAIPEPVVHPLVTERGGTRRSKVHTSISELGVLLHVGNVAGVGLARRVVMIPKSKMSSGPSKR